MKCLVISHTTIRIAVLPDFEGKSEVTHNDFPPPSSELCGHKQMWRISAANSISVNDQMLWPLSTTNQNIIHDTH